MNWEQIEKRVQIAHQIAQKNVHGAYLALASPSQIDEGLLRLKKRIDSEGLKEVKKVLPLLGVPLSVKDNIVTADFPTTAGSKILEHYIPPYTAECVRQLVQAGAIVLGKTNLDEFGMGSSNLNSAFGPVKNPRNLSLVAGGSSGGSAASVAEGSAVLSIGTDTGGSVRLPASYCGVVGFKPTYGRVSRRGVIAYGSSLDVVGGLAQSVSELVPLMQVLDQPDGLESTQCRNRVAEHPVPGSWNWVGRKIGVIKQLPLSEPASKLIQKLESLGVQKIEIDLPVIEYAIASYYLIATSEASSNLSRMDGIRFGPRPSSASQANSIEKFYEQVRSQFGAEVKQRILLGTFALSAGYADQFYLKACRVRRLLSQEMEKIFSQVEVVLSDVAAAPAPSFDTAGKMDPIQEMLTDLMTVPANLAGIPALSVPLPVSVDQAPRGLQVMAAAHQDYRCLEWGLELEKL